MKDNSILKSMISITSLLLTISGTCNAQTVSRPNVVQPDPKKAVATLSPAQQQGLENLDRIALEARQIDNPVIRTDLQALIGDALWDFDKANARKIFLDAFKNARAIEDKSEAAVVQTEVVKHVWTRDRALAEELMKELSDKDQPDNAAKPDIGVASQFGMRSSDPTIQQKLNLARNLIGDDPSAAAELISSSLDHELNSAGVVLLTQLKASNPATANAIFQNSIGRLGSLPATAAVNAAIAMADYVGSSCSLCPPQSFNAEITDGYFKAALEVLRRSAGQTFPPPPTKPELQARLVQYFHEMQAMLAVSLSKIAPPANLPELQSLYQQQFQLLDPRKQQVLQTFQRMQKATDKFGELFSMIESVNDSQQRDKALHDAVTLALRQELTEELVGRLEEKIEKIESKELHDKAWSLLKAREVEKSTAAGNFSVAHNLALKLPDPTIRARALRGFAAAIAKKGTQMLDGANPLVEAFESLNQADASIERSQLMFKIAGDLINLKDYDRAFDALQSSSGSLGGLDKSYIEQTSRAAPNSLFDYRGTFGRLGKLDFDKTMFLAQSIKWREFRLAAEIATCRSVLNKRGQNN